ncbi:MAG: GntR family transcriptional regulator [Tissierellia bacterium]|nr:GntR family transcriptional regulator [Tissierellia bacterium]
MEFNDKLPIYVQVMDILKVKISSGEIEPGGKLLSVRDFSKELKVNPNTIQRAYQELEREGLVYTQRGMGTFATEDLDVINTFKKDEVKELIRKFIEDIISLGYEKDDILNIVEEYLKRED